MQPDGVSGAAERPSPSHPWREGVLLAGEGGEGGDESPENKSMNLLWKYGFQLHPI